MILSPAMEGEFLTPLEIVFHVAGTSLNNTHASELINSSCLQ